MHDGDPEPDPGDWKEDHTGTPARGVEHELADRQRYEEDQNPAPGWNPVELVGLVLLFLLIA